MRNDHSSHLVASCSVFDPLVGKSSVIVATIDFDTNDFTADERQAEQVIRTSLGDTTNMSDQDDISDPHYKNDLESVRRASLTELKGSFHIIAHFTTM